MHELRPFIKSNLDKSIPERIRTEFPDLIEFIRAYYDFLEQSNESGYYLNRIDHVRDIDLTFDKFLGEVKKEYSLATPSYYPSIDQRNVFKRIKEFYISRGSSESVNAFFKLFFDDQSELEFPRDKILIPSDGNFDITRQGEKYELYQETDLDNSEIFEERYFFRNVGEEVFVFLNGVELDSESDYTLVYNNSSDSTAKDKRYEFTPPPYRPVGYVEKYNIPFDSRDPSHSEIIVIDDTVILSDGSLSTPATQTYQVGVDYEIGDIIEGNGLGVPNMDKRTLYFYPAEDISLGIMTWDNVNDEITIGDFATQNSIPHNIATGTPIILRGVPEPNGIQNENVIYWVRSTGASTLELYNTQEEANATSGTIGRVVLLPITLVGGEQLITLTKRIPDNSTIRIEYASSIKEKIVLDSGLTVNPTGNTFISYKEATGFTTNKGFLSDDIYIQDSYFYQAFSYILKTGVDPSNWANGFNRLLHPAGFIYFVQLVITIYLLKTDFEGEDVWIPALQPGRQFGGGLIIYIPEIFPLGSAEWEANRIKAGGNFVHSVQPIEKFFPSEFIPPAGVQITMAGWTSTTITSLTNHGLVTGNSVVFEGTVPSNLTPEIVEYWVRVIDADEFEIYDTKENALNAPSTFGRITLAGNTVSGGNIYPYRINEALSFFNQYTAGKFSDDTNRLGPTNHLDELKFLYPDPIYEFGDYTIQQAIDQQIPLNIGSFVYSIDDYLESNVSASSSTDQVLTATAHGLSTGDSVIFDSSFGSVNKDTAYYVNVIDTDEFKVYDTEANANTGGATGLISIAIGEGSGIVYPNVQGNYEIRT